LMHRDANHPERHIARDHHSHIVEFNDIFPRRERVVSRRQK
jgi:hypothetical protein